MRRFLRWLLGLKTCVECGAVCARWGRTVSVSFPHSTEDEYAYECERCSNDGVAYNEFKRGQYFEMAHPDSQFAWEGKIVTPVVSAEGLKEIAVPTTE